MGTEQGADELRMKAILKTRGVGPDAKPPVVPPMPTSRPRDWLDDILDTKAAPKAATTEKPPAPAPTPPHARTVEKTSPKPATEKKTQAKGAKKRRKKRKRPGPDTPRSAFDTRPTSSRQSLLDAWDAIPYRLKWLAYHAAAGYLGWAIGLVDWATYVTSWIADGRFANPQAIFWYLVGAATFLLHHMTRGRWWPVSWLAAVPATSTVVGVLLYGTPHL
ncbi:hypothetical protein [Streptomyces canus]|uniref:hypothetical protein n=1 Tax=Streptomyces canus TaxID=58343 RepID=UPI0033A55C23